MMAPPHAHCTMRGTIPCHHGQAGCGADHVLVRPALCCSAQGRACIVLRCAGASGLHGAVLHPGALASRPETSQSQQGKALTGQEDRSLLRALHQRGHDACGRDKGGALQVMALPVWLRLSQGRGTSCTSSAAVAMRSSIACARRRRWQTCSKAACAGNASPSAARARLPPQCLLHAANAALVLRHYEAGSGRVRMNQCAQVCRQTAPKSQVLRYVVALRLASASNVAASALPCP